MILLKNFNLKLTHECSQINIVRNLATVCKLFANTVIGNWKKKNRNRPVITYTFFYAF